MPVPSFNSATVEAIASILGDTSSGLTGSEIAKYLSEAGIDDPGPITKRIGSRGLSVAGKSATAARTTSSPSSNWS